MQNNNWNKIWSKSQKLLERSISIPVLLKETKKEIVKKGKFINYILDNHL